MFIPDFLNVWYVEILNITCAVVAQEYMAWSTTHIYRKSLGLSHIVVDDIGDLYIG